MSHGQGDTVSRCKCISAIAVKPIGSAYWSRPPVDDDNPAGKIQFKHSAAETSVGNKPMTFEMIS